MEIGEKIYELVADYFFGLIIMDVSNPSNPELVSNLDVSNAFRVNTKEIGGKFCALLAILN